MAELVMFRLLTGLVAVTWITQWLRGARAGLGKKVFWKNELESGWVFWPVRLLVLVSAVATAVYLSAPSVIEDFQHELPVYWRYSGLLFAVMGLLLFRSVFAALSGQFSTSLVIQEDHQLIKSGPYAFIRHPMYWAYILMWLALWLLSAHALIGASGVVAIVYVMIIRTPKEEAMLAEQFGEQWEAYCLQAGRYLPRGFVKLVRRR